MTYAGDQALRDIVLELRPAAVGMLLCWHVGELPGIQMFVRLSETDTMTEQTRHISKPWLPGHYGDPPTWAEVKAAVAALHAGEL